MVDDSNENVPVTTDIECERLFSEFPPSTYEEWYREAVASLKGAPFEEKVTTRTYEKIELQPMYWAKDVEDLPHMDSMPGFPGYVRGTTFGGYVLKPWDICQEIACSTPEEFNEAARHDLARGQNALKLVLYRSSRMGTDPDQDKPVQVGRDGLSLATLDDLNAALRGIDLQTVPLTIYAGAAALPMVAMVSACLDRFGLSSSVLHGCIGADPLGELAVEGSLPISMKTAYESMARLVVWAKEHAPRMQTILVQGCPYHNAGGDAVQEIAYAVATGVEYLREMGKRDILIDDAAPEMRFGFSLGSNFFMEIAKLRAARLVWGQVVEAFGGSHGAQKMTIHARTSAYTKTITDPYVNMLRNTTEAFCGAMGGVDSMHVCPFDEAIRPADELSRRVSRNLQIILQQEAHLIHPIDAPGGAWYIEKLTDAVARKAWKLFQTIGTQGGMGQFLYESGPQSVTSATAARRAKSLETRKDVLVGVNMYPNVKEVRLKVPLVDYEAIEKNRAAQLKVHRLTRIKRLHKLRTERDEARAQGCLNDITHAAQTGEGNLLALAVEAARSRCSLGEISFAMERVFGRHKALIRTISGVYSTEFGKGTEVVAAQRMADEFAAREGRRPRIMVAKIGQDGHDRGANVIATAFADLGFDVGVGQLFQPPQEAAAQAVENDVHAIGMSSLAAGHKTLLPALVEELKRLGREDIVVIVGGVIPAQDYEFLRQHGAALIFGPGRVIPIAAQKILEEINLRLS